MNEIYIYYIVINFCLKRFKKDLTKLKGGLLLQGINKLENTCNILE